MFGCKLQKLFTDCGGHDQAAVLDALSPSQQVSRLQGVEHVAPLLFFVRAVIVLVAVLEGVQLLAVLVCDFLLACPL